MLSFVKSAWPCVMALCMLCISASLSSLAYAKVEETHSDAMEAVMQNVLTRAIEIAELENASIHRSLKQAFDFEGLEDSFFGLDNGLSAQDPSSGILELMQMGQNLMPKSVNEVDGNSNADPMASMIPMMMDPNFLGNLLSEGQVSEMASQACSPLVMASMNGGLSSLMFPPNMKEMYDGFCKMMHSNGGGGELFGFNPASVMPKALGMLGPQVTINEAKAAVPSEKKLEGPGSNLISSLLGLNHAADNLPPAVPVDPRGVQFHSASAPLPEVNGVETFVFPLAELNGTEEAISESEEKFGAAQEEILVEDASGMDYITDMPNIGMMMMPDLNELMDFGAIFALEKSLPNVIDSFIDDAWEELGTEEQAYAAGHPLAEAAVGEKEEEGEEEEEMIFQVSSVDEETLSHILDNVALVIKDSSTKSPKAPHPTGADSVSFEIVSSEKTDEDEDLSSFVSNAKDLSEAQNQGFEEEEEEEEEEREEEVRSKSNPVIILAEEVGTKKTQKERINTLSALIICAIFVALVAVAVSALSAYKFCSNSMNERRYQQSEDDSDYPSERKLLRPRQMPSA